MLFSEPVDGENESIFIIFKYGMLGLIVRINPYF